MRHLEKRSGDFALRVSVFSGILGLQSSGSPHRFLCLAGFAKAYDSEAPRASEIAL
jgi:hypothetical protein